MKRIINIVLIFGWLFSILLPAYGNEKPSEIPILNEYEKTIEAFIMPGWKLIRQANGDLNKDGLPDVVGIIEKTEFKTSEAPPRIMFILFKENDGYRLSIQSGKAILKADEGGIWGDPLQDLLINRGSVVLTFYGGSSSRWGYTYRFRYQNGGWFLIGATFDTQNINTGEGVRNDHNLLTGITISTTTDEKSGKRVEKTISRGKKPLINLKDFDVNETVID